MRPTTRLGLAAFAMTAPLVLAAFAACTTDYQKGLDDPRYGPPNALAGQRQPGPSSENAADGGGAGGGNTDQPVCVANGGTLLDGGPCTVSFANDVLPAFGRSTCATPGCHGGVTPANLPRVEPSEAPAMWTEFAGFTLSDGKPYINPCSKDKTQSAIGCNLYANGACGVHMPIGGQLDQADIDKIEQWVECGAPNN